tara:strand:+ start:1987 stop:3213 length:1227 start_codon:yes stop_codon:yes gene_type:complete
MKNLFTFSFIFFSVNILAVIRFVDPNLSSGNGTTHFNSVASAVSASQDDDEIVITAGTYNENTLAISTSIKLYPQNVGDAVTFNFDINITGKAGLNIEIFDINFGSMYSQNNGSSSNRPKVYITQSSASTIDLNDAYWDLYLFQSSATNVYFKSGAIVKSSMTNLYNYDDPGTQSGRTKIIANTVSNNTVIANDSRYVLLANNNLKNLYFNGWRQTDSDQLDQSNLIINNNFSNSNIYFSFHSVSYYNIKFCNNTHSGTINYKDNSTFYRYNSSSYSNYWDDGNYTFNNQYIPNPVGWSTTQMYLRSGDGFFEWSYNTFTPTTITNLSSAELTKISGNTGSDTGHPSHFFYDIDMTRNDVGTGGGPFSTSNYPTSSGSAKAFIYYLDMPTDLFPNDNIQINAEGYHKN